MTDQGLLYERIKDIEISAPFGAKSMAGVRVTNPTELLFDEEKNRMARYFLKGSVPYELLSDYERFSLLVSNISAMSGSGVREVFSEELALLFGYNKRLTSECVEELWKLSCESIEKADYSSDELLKKCGIIQRKINEIYELKLCRRYSRCYLDYIDEIAYEMSKNTMSIVCCDVSEIKFVRTDIYHCEEAYKHFASCRDFTENDENTLLCGILYSVCEQLKKEQRALWLFVSDNLSSASQLLNYLSERRVLPKVYTILSASAAKNGAARLCRSAEIVPSFMYESGDTEKGIADKLISMASVYPISLIRYAGIHESVAISLAADNIVKRGICKALSEICDNIDEAVDIYRSIVSNT